MVEPWLLGSAGPSPTKKIFQWTLLQGRVVQFGLAAEGGSLGVLIPGNTNSLLKVKLKIKSGQTKNLFRLRDLSRNKLHFLFVLFLECYLFLKSLNIFANVSRKPHFIMEVQLVTNVSATASGSDVRVLRCLLGEN